MQDLRKSNGSGMEIEVNEDQSLEYNRRLQEFDQYFPRMQNQFQQSPEKIYYLVSTKFIDEWKNFCRYNSLKRIQPEPMNINIVNSQSKKLQEGLGEGENFQIVDSKCLEIFRGFPVFQLLRRVAYGTPGQKKVPIYPTGFNYLVLNQKDLIFFDKKQKSIKNLNLKTICTIGLQNTVEDLQNQIQNQQMLNKGYKLRVWKHSKDITMQNLYEHIMKQCKPQSYQTMKIRSLGKQLDNFQSKIGENNYQQGDYFIIECVEYDKYAMVAPDEGRCEQCRKFTKLNFPCNCKQVYYCSQQCLEKDKRYHTARCKWAEEQELLRPVEMEMREHSRRGLVGLQNLGNTCFMNSCLQCLSHTLLLTKYFIDKSYTPEINRDNPIGSKGKLVQAYANFIKNMWCQEEHVYRPYRLKGAIADINKMFSGYAQHDSQELFSFLVDGIHQDLNRIKKKPYVQSVDSNDRCDQIVSKESWLAYIQRNQSIITDTMVGQYKSKVTCPDCKKQSITFDPFITVTLPIPQKWSNQLKFYVLYSNNEHETIRINVTYKNKNLQQVYQKVSKLIQRKESQFMLYILTFDENIYEFESTPKSQLFHKIDSTTSYSSSLFVIELSSEQQKLQNRVQLTFKFSKKDWSRFESFWFKRPFFFDYEIATGLDLVKRILKYLYFDTYIYSQKKKSTNKNQNIKSYEQYEQYMLKNRPFVLYLCSGKKIKYSYSSRIQIQFQNQAKIEDDTKLSEQIDFKNLKDYEIDIRFLSKGLEFYNIDRLKNFTDKTKKMSSYQEQDQDKNVTLDECFEALEYPQQLETGNEWYCPACKEHKLASKQLYIYKTPQVLILHLKRFKSKGSIRKQKNETNVMFPFELDMKKYITNTQPINAYIPYVKSQNKYIEPSYNLNVSNSQNTMYELYAISNHYGGLGGGHYTAYAKNNDKWYSFNDSSVSQVPSDRVKGSGAYILFYKRKQRE